MFELIVNAMTMPPSICTGLGWHGDGLFRVHTSFEPGGETSIRNSATRIMCPIRQALGFAKSCYKMGLASIPFVLVFRDPPAIPRLIGAVIVNTINLQVGRIAIGIRPVSEAYETLAPFFTYQYTAPTIMRKHSVFHVVTSGFHGVPDAIKMSAGTSRFTMKALWFILKATARAGMVIKQLGHANSPSKSTHTAAWNKPLICAISSLGLLKRETNDGPSCKYIAYLYRCIIGRFAVAHLSSALRQLYTHVVRYVKCDNRNSVTLNV